MICDVNVVLSNNKQCTDRSSLHGSELIFQDVRRKWHKIISFFFNNVSAINNSINFGVCLLKYTSYNVHLNSQWDNDVFVIRDLSKYGTQNTCLSMICMDFRNNQHKCLFL